MFYSWAPAWAVSPVFRLLCPSAGRRPVGRADQKGKLWRALSPWISQTLRGDILYWTWDIEGKWLGSCQKAFKNPKQERQGGPSPDIWSRVGAREWTKEKSFGPCFECKGWFDSVYSCVFFHPTLFEAKILLILELGFCITGCLLV